MRINHNIDAMNVHRNMNINLINNGKSMEKLSSGSRINRSGDDVAGLSISEKMRSQIRGLNQSAKNAQDGISLIQTAEGALSETHSILQRMRELSTQAANGTNVEADRKAIQSEINQLTSEVNRIGNTTEFNTKKLLCSGLSGDVKDNIIRGLKSGWLEKSAELINRAYGIEATGSKLEVFVDEGIPYGELAHVGGTSEKLELHIDASDFANGDGDSGNNIHGKLYNDRIIAHEMTHAVMNSAFGIAKMNDLHHNNKVWFIEGTAEGIAGADERLKRIIGNGAGIDNGKLNALATRANNLLNGAAWQGTDEDYSAGYVIIKYIKDTGIDLKNVMNSVKANGSAGLDAAINIAGLKAGFENNFKNYITTKVHLDWGSDESDVGSIIGSDHGGTAINAEGVIDGTTESKDQPLAGKFDITWPKGSESNSDITLQIGANHGQSFNLKLRDMRASALRVSGGTAGGSVTSKDGLATAKYTEIKEVTTGIDGEDAEYALDVSNHENASAAIKIIDEAIGNVSEFRGQLGAMQNRLEHTIANLKTSSENLEASESRIRDMDMAKEMINFSKSDILMKASQVMIAHAEFKPQSVIRLLK